MNKKGFPKAFFITGTDTGVGKTVVSAILAKGLGAAYWKPVQSGLDGETDTETVQSLTALPENHFFPEAYRLRNPLSPHLAAKEDGLHISLETMGLPKGLSPFPHLIVEGAGGLMVPLNERHFMIDLMERLHLPVILVARSGLGTINHTLLSLEMVQRHGLHVWGVVMNGPLNPGNREAITHFGKTEVLAEIEPVTPLNSEIVSTLFNRFF